MSALNEFLTEEKSIYLQICDMIETDILRGALLDGERAPSTNELAKFYTINPATAAKGLGILIERGILIKRRGLGMFVADGAAEVIRTRRKNEFKERKLRELLTEARSLGISKDELIQMLAEGESNG